MPVFTGHKGTEAVTLSSDNGKKKNKKHLKLDFYLITVVTESLGGSFISLQIEHVLPFHSSVMKL